MSTLENAREVLTLMARLRRDISMTDLVTELGVAKSSASRTLSMMANHGFLERDPTTRAYRPGRLLMEVSYHFRASRSTASLIEEVLDELVRDSGFTGYVNVLDGRDALVVQMRTGSRNLQVYTPPGARTPAYASAAGRAILASIPEVDLDLSLYADFTDARGNAPRSREELLERLAEVRTTGWSLSRGEYVATIGGVAAAVCDPASGLRYSFGLAIPSEEFSPALIARWGAKVYEAACHVGRSMGDPFWLEFRGKPDSSAHFL